MSESTKEQVVLIIGASGAIGRSLVHKLCTTGAKVVAAIRRTPLPTSLTKLFPPDILVTEDNVDVRDRQSLLRAFCNHSRIDSVWMLAAPLSVESARDPAGAENVVVGGMQNVLSVMTECNCRNICFSDSIGSFGHEAPRENCTAQWLLEYPEQDPGSDYGRQKRRCRELMAAWSAGNKERTSRFAVIPGVLHTDTKWGAGTTEYALEAVRWAAGQGGGGGEREGEGGGSSSKAPYICPIGGRQRLPMIMRDDLIDGMVKLTFAKRESMKENECGYAMAGLSFSPEELFASLQRRCPEFEWSCSEEMNNPAKLFAELWPNHLSGEEAKNDLNFQAKMTSLDEIVDILLNAWEQRYSSNQTLAPSL
jgi:nucleoside-diphosphate-sugar epimerase